VACSPFTLLIAPTFNKDFGELAFRLGQQATPDLIRLRPRPRSPDLLIRFTRAILAQGQSWSDHITVAEEIRPRLGPLGA
jgi:hypothetical protein